MSLWASPLPTSRNESNSSELSKTGGSRGVPLSAISEIQAAQDDAGRIAFEFPCLKLARGPLFNLVAPPHELRFALVRLDPLRFFQVVHGGCADGAGDFPYPVNHRKQDDHPVKFVTAKAAACQCHFACLSWRTFLLSSDVLIGCGIGCSPCRYEAAAARLTFTGGGSISAILRRQSASELWGPETNVPLTFLEYQPGMTPSRSDSSVLT